LPDLGIHLPRDSVCRGKYSATADDGGAALHRRQSVVRVVAIPRHTCADKNSLEERCNRWWAVFSGQSRNVGLGGTESAVGISGPVVRDLAFVDRGALALHGQEAQPIAQGDCRISAWFHWSRCPDWAHCVSLARRIKSAWRCSGVARLVAMGGRDHVHTASRAAFVIEFVVSDADDDRRGSALCGRTYDGRGRTSSSVRGDIEVWFGSRVLNYLRIAGCVHGIHVAAPG